MLDLEALIGHMQELAGEVARSARETLDRRDRAVAQVEAMRSPPTLQEAVREAVRKFGQDMALPAEGREPGSVHPAPVVEDYSVLAVDGSQVAPDYHHIASWYVINTGSVVFRYGGFDDRPRAQITSRPELKPPRRGVPSPEAPLPAANGEVLGGEPVPEDALGAAVGAPSLLEVERLQSELRAAARLVEEEAEPGRTVLLLDGPLVQWRMITGLKGRDRAEVIRAFQDLLARAHAARVPVAGYISRSRAVEWVTLLRFSLCPRVATDNELCAECRRTLLGRNADPQPDSHHAALAGVRDIDLAAQLLAEPGMRSEVLELQSRTWSELGGHFGAAGFFYLRASAQEIGRVELPSWVWQDEGLMSLLHQALWDQCDAGRGYPMVLSEAHEAAVVRAADRDTFYTLIERVLATHGVDDAALSAKATSKRRPIA